MSYAGLHNPFFMLQEPLLMHTAELEVARNCCYCEKDVAFGFIILFPEQQQTQFTEIGSRKNDSLIPAFISLLDVRNA